MSKKYNDRKSKNVLSKLSSLNEDDFDDVMELNRYSSKIKPKTNKKRKED